MGQPPPTPNQPNRGSTIVLWIAILLFVASGIVGVYTYSTGQSTVSSVISFLIAFFSIPIGFLQINRQLFTKLQTSFKTDKLSIMIAVLVFLLITSFIANFILIKWSLVAHGSGSPTPTITQAVANSATPTMPTPTPTPTPPTQKPILVNRYYARGSAVSQVQAHFPLKVIKGNLIVVAITQWIGTVTSIVDNTKDTYIPVTSAQYADSSQDYVELYYAKAVKGGDTTLTVTFSTVQDSDNNPNDMNVGIYEFSGIDQTNPIDQQPVSQLGNSTTPDGGTISSTTTSDLYFVVGVDNDKNQLPPAAGSGYKLLDHEDSSDNERFYAEYRVAPAGSYHTDFSIDTSSAWAIIGVSFKRA